MFGAFYSLAHGFPARLRGPIWTKSRTKLSGTVFAVAHNDRGKRLNYRCFVIRSALFAGVLRPGRESTQTQGSTDAEGAFERMDMDVPNA